LSRARASGSQRRRLRRKLIEYPEIVAGVEQASSHSLSHAAEAYETDFHIRPSTSQRVTKGATLTRASTTCKKVSAGSAG
jgi:hypothetical protein